ncbi:hypothetical protein [Nonomuraea endophytica]|uniref:Uncharacterized protein n=1 Tax=Nonomuraea endophytica TaxID=714136 RepID=A0A7W7ZXK6_9ACTN|nr:hypothetical protein [Nonomuraea endophytica]MBB5075658.1 hypothetical protein [Nonomuraea endophytica]
MTQSVIPQPGMWFEHALNSQNDLPARYVITQIADPGPTALPQVHYQRLGAAPDDIDESIDADLFDDIVLRWLTPEEAARAKIEAEYHP